MIWMRAVNLYATLTFFHCWLHLIRLCNARIDMVFTLKFWYLPFQRFGSSPYVALWQGRSQKEISCVGDFRDFALNLDLFSNRWGLLTVKIHLGDVLSVLPLNRFLASMFSSLSCFPPFSSIPHTTLLSGTHLACPIVASPGRFLSSDPLSPLLVGCHLWVYDPSRFPSLSRSNP